MASASDLRQIVEAALLAAGTPLDLDRLQGLFDGEERPGRKALREAIAALQQDYEGRGMELVEVGSGFRIQVRADYAPWVSRLWQERPARYSRAMLETLALIAYRQPITRGEIEEIRGVSVSSSIMKTLMEREWVRVVGHRDVPGRPSLYATTREFLDYFGLKSLDQLPPLQEIRDLESINRELELEIPGLDSGEAAGDALADAPAPEPGDETPAEGPAVDQPAGADAGAQPGEARQPAGEDDEPGGGECAAEPEGEGTHDHG
ncbi:MAG TPA: SMC-Scp complex subunit ScpB [Sedimenticola thiotaurini]|uniref:SMC-Scp complex subunit ScpB n=1 Tax=Sedimenticola thiotaurini TaxID=1543721 RepID=A0A831RP63_9GAMM|nr:SMC-Scp complex subunit ScpB [Sedimenticola thiotaurini]